MMARWQATGDAHATSASHPPAPRTSSLSPTTAVRSGVVLSHGFTGTPASMRPWADHLAAAGYTVRLPLLPGHGGTWQETNRTRWPQWYGAVESAFDEVAARCDIVFAGGLSMGGALVTRLAEQKGDKIAGLVLVNPSFGTAKVAEKLAPYVSWLVRSRPSIGGDIKKPGVEEPANDRTPVVAGASVVRLWKVVTTTSTNHRAGPHVPQQRGPRRRRSSGRLLRRGATSTTVEEILLENSYHVATLDNDADGDLRR